MKVSWRWIIYRDSLDKRIWRTPRRSRARSRGRITHGTVPRMPRLRSAISQGAAALQTVMPSRMRSSSTPVSTVAVVVAETLEQAQYAGLVRVEYVAQAPRTQLDRYTGEAYPHQPLFGISPD